MYPSSLDGHPRQPEPRTLLMHPSCTPVSLSGAAVAETPRYKYQTTKLFPLRKESALAPECARVATAKTVEATSRRQRESVADETTGGLFNFI